MILFKANFLFLFQLYSGYNKLGLFINIFTVMKEQQDITRWLPTTKKEVEMRGWNELDVILFSGDAYVDHPAFGPAVIGRIIENEGYRIAIVPQPNWQDDLRDFRKLGKPKYFFGVTSGCMDSMVNHYTANKRLRSTDAYTPGGETGFPAGSIGIRRTEPFIGCVMIYHGVHTA